MNAPDEHAVAEDFGRLARIAAALTGAPTAGVAMIGPQGPRMLASAGPIAFDLAGCLLALGDRRVAITHIPDAAADALLGERAVGVGLFVCAWFGTEAAHAMGAVWAADAERRSLSPAQATALVDLAEAARCVWAREAVVRVQAEELRRARDQAGLAAECAGLGLWEWSAATGALRLSDRWRDIVGLGEAVAAEDWRALVHPEDLDAIAAQIAAGLHGASDAVAFTFRLRHRAGGWRQVLARGRVCARDGDGKPTRIAGAYLDGSTSAVVPMRSDAGDAYFRLASHMADVGDWRMDAAPGKAALEAPTLTNLNLPALLDLRGGGEREAVQQALYAAMLRAERRVKDSDTRFATAVQGMSVGLWDWVDVRTQAHWWSPRFFELLGYCADEIVAGETALSELLHPDDRERVVAARSEHLRTREPFQVECRLRHKTELHRWFLLSGQAIWDEAGAPVRMIGSIMDVTERKQIELMKDEFVSTVNHEIRTPLTSIYGALRLLEAKAAPLMDDKHARLLALARASCTRLNNLVNDILDLEKIAAGQMEFHIERVALGPLVTDIVERHLAIAESHEIRFETRIDAEGAFVDVDPSRFNQALVNLLSNAAKYSPPGGVVIIEARRVGPAQVRVCVQDFGPGIPEAFKPKVFQRFAQADVSTTRKAGGTGLGLAITKTLIEACDGAVGFDSEEGRGSAFHFTLPLRPPPPSGAAHSFASVPGARLRANE